MNTTGHEELKLLYRISVNDIAFFKNQQWRVTYYALLLHAALIAISEKYLTRFAQREWLSAVAWIVLYLSLILIYELNDAIRIRRDRLEHIRGKRENGVFVQGEFSERFFNAWESGSKEDQTDSPLWIMFLSLTVGLIVTLLILFK